MCSLKYVLKNKVNKRNLKKSMTVMNKAPNHTVTLAATETKESRLNKLQGALL